MTDSSRSQLKLMLDQKALQHLQKTLGYTFQDEHLLHQALCHSSFPHLKTINDHYERLEFLGDRVLGICVAEMLFDAYPEDSEGDLARRHSQLVSAKVLVDVARSLQLHHLIQAETDKFAQQRPSVMADVVEALLAVIYRESGLLAAKAVVQKFWQHRVNDMVQAPRDPKSALQEWSHKNGLDLPIYELVERKGPDHKPVFYVEVQLTQKSRVKASKKSQKSNIKAPLCDQQTFKGLGTSRQKAEINAAKTALEFLALNNENIK